MKALFKVRENLQFEVEGKEQRDVFEQIASLQEVFGESSCGLCKNKNVAFVVRTVDENNFFELQCRDCGGKLALSQNKKGGSLYPVRKLKNGLPAKISDEAPFDFTTKGWHKFDKSKQGKVSGTPISPPPANNKKR